ncbi:MAG: NADH-quinone oxidoreductase subunit J [Armatimonas sp.]
MTEFLQTLFTGPGLLFAAFAFGALATAILVVANKNPVRSALFLVLNLFCVAVLYLLLSAFFLAAVQVIVYAGAIMVLFLFVIMLLNLGSPEKARERLKLQVPAAVVAALSLALIVTWAIATSVPGEIKPVALPPDTPVSVEAMGTPEGIGRTLYNPALPWLLPFEVTSILLLVATIGAVVLAKKGIGEEVKA